MAIVTLKFLHLYTSNRHLKNLILEISDEERWISDEEDIHNAFYDYYSLLFIPLELIEAAWEHLYPEKGARSKGSGE